MPEYGDSGSVTVRDGILTVTQLNMLTKGIIDANPLLGKVAIRGEISNLSTPSSGHTYISRSRTSGAFCVRLCSARRLSGCGSHPRTA